MPVGGPTLVRRQLGRQLRDLRQRAGMTAPDVSDASIMSPAKLRRIESGSVRVAPGDVRELCRFYRADDPTTENLAALAAGTAGHGWWEEYADVMDTKFALFIGLEQAASHLHSYEAELVPGLFQTAGYARAVSCAYQPEWPEAAVEKLVDLRLQRQQAVLGQSRPPQIATVLNAAVLARAVGGPGVMSAQVQHLRRLATLDHITIQVVPWEAGAHAAMAGSFTIFDFENPADPAVAYTDTHSGARYAEETAQLVEYRRVFALTCQHAITLEEHAQ